ncbi:WD40/YVTN/BNR-like repeat-containing protein [Halospeciosus flavus]|uniref:WD40/YVTN/BNR-like repeat-containing protein n=1 Tax=Halospeciosus flavus TaxID=3032283 RepID=A0ABD5Z396_9EURY|nr:hypothetical protein [Halospeciosus flavus]
MVSTVDGPYAVADKGVLVRRQDDGDWAVVFDDGPATRDNSLFAAAATDDGERVWFAGSSGALGYYDVTTNEKHDYTAPKEKTSTWEAIAVSGKAGNEKLLVANGSGEVLPGYVDGCCPQWGQVSKPDGTDSSTGGSGATITGLAASPDGYGYAINSSGSVFMTTADDAWEKIGIENAQVNFTDVYADGETVLVTAGSGRVYRYEPNCKNWTPLGVASVTLNSIAHDGDELVAVGNDGVVFRKKGNSKWTKRPTPTSNDLNSVTLSDGIDAAVGKAGTILERGDRDDQNKKTGSQQDGSTSDSTSGDSTSDSTTSS